jgi:hypothetical protein
MAFSGILAKVEIIAEGRPALGGASASDPCICGLPAGFQDSVKPGWLPGISIFAPGLLAWAEQRAGGKLTG